MATKRFQNGATREGFPMDKDARGRPPHDLAGLRNQIRMICREAAAGNLREVGLQLDALLDDLSNDRVRFDWSTCVDRNEGVEATRRGIAEYVAAGLAD